VCAWVCRYSFPGSTSSIDLHALCGWIPETFRLGGGDDAAEAEAEAEACWGRLVAGQGKGTGLFTVGSRALDAGKEARSGLVRHSPSARRVPHHPARRVMMDA
jgi:hypothetical protein